MLINRQMQKDIETLFNYRGAGVLEEAPPLITFSRDDLDPFDKGFV